jgi:hypothetical protein
MSGKHRRERHTPGRQGAGRGPIPDGDADPALQFTGSIQHRQQSLSLRSSTAQQCRDAPRCQHQSLLQLRCTAAASLAADSTWCAAAPARRRARVRFSHPCSTAVCAPSENGGESQKIKGQVARAITSASRSWRRRRQSRPHAAIIRGLQKLITTKVTTRCIDSATPTETRLQRSNSVWAG